MAGVAKKNYQADADWTASYGLTGSLTYERWFAFWLLAERTEMRKATRNLIAFWTAFGDSVDRQWFDAWTQDKDEAEAEYNTYASMKQAKSDV